MKMLLSLIAFALFLPFSALGQATISGYAFSLDSGEAIAGARIVLKDSRGLDIADSITAVTDDDGHYTLSDVEAGHYLIKASTEYEHDGIHYVLVSDVFSVPEQGKRVHFGFWRLALLASYETSEAIQKAGPGERISPSGPWRIDGVPEGTWVRSGFLKSSIKTGAGEEILNVAYPERM